MNIEIKLKDKINKLNFKAATPREIGAKLDIRSSFELQEVTKVLNAMVAEGGLIKSGNKYSKFDRNMPSKPKENGKGRAADKQGSTNADSKDDRRGAKPGRTNSSIRAREPKVYENEFVGTLRGNKRGFSFLIREDGGNDVFIPAKSMGNAMHGDTVKAIIINGDEGKVTNVVKSNITRIVGEYHKTNAAFGFVVPDGNSYYKDIYIPYNKSMSAADSTKVVVEITYPGKSPEGKITEIIGKSSDKQSEVLSILKSNGFFNEFDTAAIDEAKEKQLTSDFSGRTDYRGLLTITIDGEDSKDLDDAISLEVTPSGYVLYVHIADVSHYVTPGSVLDEEAFKRCTSVYFPGSVYPMLPQILSNDLCSLNEGEDRLTLTCAMTFDKQGNQTACTISKSVINNDYRMTYNSVTAILGGDKELCAKYSGIVEIIGGMEKLAAAIKSKRDARGNINFDTKECKIILDDSGNVDHIEPYPYTVSNGIIEEFMIAANEAVAEHVNRMELPFVYRVHETPDPSKIEGFNVLIKSLGFPVLDVTKVKPGELQKLLTQIQGLPLEHVISKLMLRCMKKAKYSDECLGHFGLASEFYCHFTSPIRRYPDLQIHRVLKGIIDGSLGSIPKLAVRCKEVADVSSERERSAELAERDIDDFYKAEYMARHVGDKFEGVISGVTSFGIFVELSNTCEGLARLDNLPKDNYNFIESRYKLQGATHEYALGQTVNVEVIDADPIARRVTFNVIEKD